MLIESGVGNGKLAAVDENNRLLTNSISMPFEHYIAKDFQNTFAASFHAVPNPGQVTVGVIANTAPDKKIVITRIMLQALVSGGTALPNTSSFFTLETNAEYSVGGDAVKVSNLSSGSAVAAPVRAYDNNPGLTAQPEVAYRVFALQGQPLDIQTTGNVIILPGKSVAIGYQSDQNSGGVIANVSFVVVDAE